MLEFWVTGPCTLLPAGGEKVVLECPAMSGVMPSCTLFQTSANTPDVRADQRTRIRTVQSSVVQRRITADTGPTFHQPVHQPPCHQTLRLSGDLGIKNADRWLVKK
ncbi:Hypp9777 [Branchiostoma lanceolatum]|uniref:Hypp9777 protein n=1 Tax=Branchiostoma lanceolatum TaxID=7740 RepID=A0A8S4MPY4_BRALA|nr:Hypp9777 [Branchiostoma lanceolatum]